MVRLNLKALSINDAYRGRRFATPEMKQFKSDVYKLMPRYTGAPLEKVKVMYRFGVSSSGSDGDNLIKCFQDCLADNYRFNDNQIYEWHVFKEKVKKGEEFIEYELSPL